MKLDGAGWLDAVRRVPSPNHDARPEGMAVELVVVHNISLPTDRKSTRLNSSHNPASRMPSSA
jgi:AmpD protein